MFDLFARLAYQPGNLLISEFSLRRALGMVLLGARGETRRQMAEVLGEDEQRLPPANEVDLTEANGIWVQSGIELDPEFQSAVHSRYDAEVAAADFANGAEPARLKINRWVEQATRGQIRDLFEPGAIDATTPAVLANAMSFRGSWASPFDPVYTGPAPFHLADGSTVPVEHMTQLNTYGFARRAGMTLVDLPYRGDCSMLVLVPDRWESCDLSQFATLESELQPVEIMLSLPRFETTHRLKAARLLSEMGMPNLFGDGADLTGITTAAPLWVSDVVHEAHIQVDEVGTEAGVSTGIEMTLGSPPPPVWVNRPFHFWIRCGGTTLFRGRIMDPRS